MRAGVGGIVGFFNGKIIADCYNKGEVTGLYAGGIAYAVMGGSNYPIMIDKCYNMGEAAATNSGCGLAYSLYNAQIKNSYYDKETSKQDKEDQKFGIPLGTEDMQKMSTFRVAKVYGE